MRLPHLLAAVAATTLAFALPSHAHAHGEEKHPADIGQKGDPAAISRTVEVIMTDNRYAPSDLKVKSGETIKFIVRNDGEFVHEFNIGNADNHLAHQQEMMTMMEKGILEVDRINHHMMGHGEGTMSHDDPNAVLLAPGESGEIIWTFPQSGMLQFACNVPGHYEDGMVGDIRIGNDNGS